MGIPALRPNNKGCAPCLWTITSSACPYMGLCARVCVCGGVCAGSYEEEAVAKNKIKKRGRYFLTSVTCEISAWAVNAPEGRAGGKRELRVSAIPCVFCQIKSLNELRR